MAFALVMAWSCIPAQTAVQSDERQGEWVFAPIPINSPAIGAGLVFAAARLFPFNKQDKASPLSALGVGGVITNNGTRALSLGGRLYLKEDRYRVTAAFGGANINVDLYGIGQAAGDRGTFIPLKANGQAGIGEFLFRLRKNVYLGARSQYRNVRLSLNQDKLDSSDITVQPPQQVAEVIEEIRSELLQQQTVAVGPRLEWDSRDNLYYPKQGVLMDLGLDLFAKGLGSKWTYQTYKAVFNKYVGVREHQVLAFRGMACAAAGERVPIYDLCLFGASNDLRGYPGGRYQDRRMFATQAEYRLMLPSKGFAGRFGVVAFAGVGGVGKTFSDIGFSQWLPGAGGGIRFRMTKKNPINFRVDYGIGRVGRTLSVGVMEAF